MKLLNCSFENVSKNLLVFSQLLWLWLMMEGGILDFVMWYRYLRRSSEEFLMIFCSSSLLLRTECSPKVFSYSVYTETFHFYKAGFKLLSSSRCNLRTLTIFLAFLSSSKVITKFEAFYRIICCENNCFIRHKNREMINNQSS